MIRIAHNGTDQGFEEYIRSLGPEKEFTAADLLKSSKTKGSRLVTKRARS